MKTHNRPSAKAAKVELRKNVLRIVKPAHVLDCYCGEVGEMFKAAWSNAASYTGIDLDWDISDTRRRFVGDTRRVLRAIDLSPFNVFDLDAFGAPWEAALIIASRRKWAKGERGAFVFTDGAGKRIQFGASLPNGLRILTGVDIAPGAGTAGAHALHRMGVAEVLKRAGVRVEKRWEAVSPHGEVGSMPMFYTAAVTIGR